MQRCHTSKRAKKRAAGKTGKTEVPISGGRKLDAASKNRATEVERSGTTEGLTKAVLRLRDSGKNQKVLQVPQKDLKKAAKVMRDNCVSGTVKNMSSTRRQHIPKKKSCQI